jgi:hypothetical protein
MAFIPSVRADARIGEHTRCQRFVPSTFLPRRCVRTTSQAARTFPRPVLEQRQYISSDVT